MKINMKEELGMWLCVTIFSAIAIGLCVLVGVIGKALGVSGASALALVFPCALVIAALVVYGIRWWVENIESPNASLEGCGAAGVASLSKRLLGDATGG